MDKNSCDDVDVIRKYSEIGLTTRERIEKFLECEEENCIDGSMLEWEEIGNYYVANKQIPKIKYDAKKFVQYVKECAKLYVESGYVVPTDKREGRLTCIYKMGSYSSLDYTIRYSSVSLKQAFFFAIYSWMTRMRQDPLFDENDVDDVYCEVLEYVKSDKLPKLDAVLRDRKAYYNELEGKKHVESTIDTTYDYILECLDEECNKYINELGFDKTLYQKSVVYMYKNKKTGDVYIGSTVNFKKRMNGHMQALSTGMDRKLYDAINIYGEDCFEISIIEKYPCSTKFHLHLREDYHMIKYDSISKGYNEKYNCQYSEYLKYPLSPQNKKWIKEMIFLSVQRYLTNKFLDESKCVGNVIYKMTNTKTNKSFIHYTDVDLSKEIANIYGNAIVADVSVKYGKLFPEIKKYKYTDFEYTILKKYEPYDGTVYKTVDAFILKYDTIENGYNSSLCTDVTKKCKMVKRYAYIKKNVYCAK